MKDLTRESVSMWLSNKSEGQQIRGIGSARSVWPPQEAAQRLVEAYLGASGRHKIRSAVIKELANFESRTALRALFACSIAPYGPYEERELIDAVAGYAAADDLEVIAEHSRSTQAHERSLAEHATKRHRCAQFATLCKVLTETRDIAIKRDFESILRDPKADPDIRRDAAVALSALCDDTLATELFQILHSARHTYSVATDYSRGSWLARALASEARWRELAESLIGAIRPEMYRALCQAQFSEPAFGRELIELLSPTESQTICAGGLPDIGTQHNIIHLLRYVPTPEVVRRLKQMAFNDKGITVGSQWFVFGNEWDQRIRIAALNSLVYLRDFSLCEPSSQEDLLKAIAKMIEDTSHVPNSSRQQTFSQYYALDLINALRHIKSTKAIPLILHLWRIGISTRQALNPEEGCRLGDLQTILCGYGVEGANLVAAALGDNLIGSAAIYVVGELGGVDLARPLLEDCCKNIRRRFRQHESASAIEKYLRKFSRALSDEILGDICSLPDYEVLTSYSETTGDATYRLVSLEGIRSMARAESARRDQGR